MLAMIYCAEEKGYEIIFSSNRYMYCIDFICDIFIRRE